MGRWYTVADARLRRTIRKQAMTGDSYNRLLEHSRRLSSLKSVAKLLDWDQQTHMPPKGAEDRSEQRALLAGLIHEIVVSEELHQLLEQLDGSGELASLGPEGAANVRELRREHDREYRVPTALVSEIERTAGLAHQHWVDARQNNDFRAFSPWLEKIVHLTRQWADAVGYEIEPYDALLDVYEPGTRARDVEPLFQALRSELVPLADAIGRASRQPDTSVLQRPFDAATLHGFSRRVAEELGFDFQAGRMDRSVHPFCSGVAPSDVRITTSFREENPVDSLFALIHEVGHGLYHQGLLPEHRGTPMGTAVSLGVHESQSRWWEDFVARNEPFWEHFYPGLKELFPSALAGVSRHEFVGAINAVRPSLIRVEADEVTYNLHVVVRFELERALFQGELQVADLPGAWDEKMEQYLGVRPSNHAEGVLQDVHWPHGMFGYFPTYTFGNLYAAQLNAAIRKDMPDLDRRVAQGQFAPILEWMRQKVHRRGSLYPPTELIRRITGQGVSTRPLLDYLRRKFVPLYGL
jgi:carboxypeptidase Taq